MEHTAVVGFQPKKNKSKTEMFSHPSIILRASKLANLHGQYYLNTGACFLKYYF